MPCAARNAVIGAYGKPFGGAKGRLLPEIFINRKRVQSACCLRNTMLRRKVWRPLCCGCEKRLPDRRILAKGNRSRCNRTALRLSLLLCRLFCLRVYWPGGWRKIPISYFHLPNLRSLPCLCRTWFFAGTFFRNVRAPDLCRD